MGAAGASDTQVPEAPRVFISYRRADSSGHAGRLYDWLTMRFGPERVFQDADTIWGGSDFLVEIERALAQCDALIALIGPQWLSTTDAQGRRRLDDPADLVRLEIEVALKRGIRVVPVLIQGTPMPSAEEIPDSLRSLARRHALELSDVRFRVDVDLLIQVLERARDERLEQEAAARAEAAEQEAAAESERRAAERAAAALAERERAGQDASARAEREAHEREAQRLEAAKRAAAALAEREAREREARAQIAEREAAAQAARERLDAAAQGERAQAPREAEPAAAPPPLPPPPPAAAPPPLPPPPPAAAPLPLPPPPPLPPQSPPLARMGTAVEAGSVEPATSAPPPMPAPPAPPKRPSGIRPKTSRTTWVAAAVIALLVFAGVAVFALTRPGGEERSSASSAPTTSITPTSTTAPTSTPTPTPQPTPSASQGTPAVREVGRPTDLSVVDRTTIAITLSWKRAPNGGPVDHYLIKRDGKLVRGSQGNVLRVSERTYVDRDVEPGATYTYQIVAVGVDGSKARSVERDVTVPNPPEPSISPAPTTPGPGPSPTCTFEDHFNGLC